MHFVRMADSTGIETDRYKKLADVAFDSEKIKKLCKAKGVKTILNDTFKYLIKYLIKEVKK